MTSGNRIQYLSHHNIDKNKWDACIASAPDSLVYNYSWLLDSMTGQWDALVQGDYEAVMPLACRRKYGIRYLYQPLFIAQTGITGNNIDTATTDAFLRAVPAHFKMIDVNLHENNSTEAFTSFRKKRVNMLLDTTRPYNEVTKDYHRLAGRMITKARQASLYIEENADIRACIDFYRQQYNERLKISQQDYAKLIGMFELGRSRQQAIVLAAKKDGQLMGVYLLLQDQHYSYSVVGGSSPAGKEQGAFYMLTDHAIQLTAASNRLFRFEGSDIPGIAAFNQQFGAKPFYYDHIKINRLPPLLRAFKR